jgi:hypothetical protein
MKKIFLFVSLALVFWTCSTELDILDNWKETTVVYCLLDQSQPKQYVRIEKAFLGPDNALSMAQQYDSINYVNQLDVWLQEKDVNGNITNYYQLTADTVTNKDPGIFYAPDYVLYSLVTPPQWVSQPTIVANHTFYLVVTNSATGNVVNSTTALISDFNITRPSQAQIDIRKITAQSMVDVQWNSSPKARIYQVAARFHYKERDLANVVTSKTAPDWVISTVQVDSLHSYDPQGISFDPNAFYKYLATVIFNDGNVTARQADYIEFMVYAGGQELQTYMTVNSPSTSLVQEKPLYTNINNGLGVFSSRYQKFTAHMNLTLPTQDTLAKGQYSCSLQFLDRNEIITNNSDLPPGCQ